MDHNAFLDELETTFEPPQAGDAPEKVKKVLSAVYSSCRQEWVDAHPDDPENKDNKTSCAKQAWSQANKQR